MHTTPTPSAHEPARALSFPQLALLLLGCCLLCLAGARLGGLGWLASIGIGYVAGSVSALALCILIGLRDDDGTPSARKARPARALRLHGMLADPAEAALCRRGALVEAWDVDLATTRLQAIGAYAARPLDTRAKARRDWEIDRMIDGAGGSWPGVA